MKTAISKDHPWMNASLDLRIMEHNAEYFTPKIYDQYGETLRLMTDEECEAEFERRAGRTYFRITAKHGEKRSVVESPMILSKDREEALQGAFSALARSFFNHYHSQPHVEEIASSTE